jgi:hypothetical protein
MWQFDILKVCWCHLSLILGMLFKSSIKQIDCLGKRKFVLVLLNNAQNVPMLVKWHHVCPKLEEFYFDISSKRLFGYLWCIGTKANKIHDVRVIKINQKQTQYHATMHILDYILFHLNVITIQIISHVLLFKQSHPHFVMYWFIQLITLSIKLSLMKAFIWSNHVLFYSINYIFILSYIGSFNWTHHHMYFFYSIDHLFHWITNFGIFNLILSHISSFNDSYCLIYQFCKLICNPMMYCFIQLFWNLIITWATNFPSNLVKFCFICSTTLLIATLPIK